MRPLKKEEGLDTDFLSKQTPGFSGADIANVCNEAALIAARGEKKAVGKQDFLDAVDRIVGGLEKKNKIITPAEKEAIAYHEAGHATVSWMLRACSATSQSYHCTKRAVFRSSMVFARRASYCKA